MGKILKFILKLVMAVLLLIASLQVIHRDRYSFSIDLTKDKSNTLTPETLNLLNLYAKESKQVHFRGYFRDFEVHVQVKELLQFFKEGGLRATVDFFDPDVEFLKAKSDRVNGANTLVVEVDGKSQNIEKFSEETLSTALYLLIQTQAKKIYIESGNGDGLESVHSFTEILTRLGYDWQPGGFKSAKESELVILVNPTQDIQDIDLDFYKNLIKSKVSLLVLVDSARPTTKINQFLQMIGVKYEDDLVVLHPDDPMTQQVSQNVAYLNVWDLSPDGRPWFKSQMPLMFPDSRSISTLQLTSPLAFTPVLALQSKEDSLLVQKIFNLEDLQKVSADQILKGSASVVQIGEITDGSTRLGRLGLFGSCYPIQNRGFGNQVNQNFMLNTISYLLGEKIPSLHRPEVLRPPLKPIHSGVLSQVLIGLSFGYPFLMLIIGYLVLRWRR